MTKRLMMLASQMPVNPFKHKALSLIDRRIFIEFMHTLKGARQFKPQPNQFRNLNWVLVWPVPVGNPNENQNFNQVVPVFVQGNALKAFRYRLFHVLYQNVVIVMALIRKLDSCLTPPSNQGWGGCFRTPELNFFNFFYDNF